MAYPKLLEVASILLQKSQAGEINWERTANENTFQTSLSRYSILINKMVGHEGNEHYSLKIFNEEGREIEELTGYAARTEGGLHLSEVFELARRTAMGVEKALDEVLVALRKAS